MALTQVSTSGIKNGSVSTADLADGSITTAKVAAGGVTTAKVADGNITTAKIADGGVTTAKVADDAITADKLNNTGVTAGSYTLSSVTVDAQGRVTAASSGTPVDADKIIEGNTEVEAVDTGSDGHIKATTEGSERFRVGPAGQMGIGGANYGASGQVLMSGGASAAPTWGDVSSSPTFEATAYGSIADGNKVIIQSDGKVAAVAEDSATFNLGSIQKTFSNSLSGNMSPLAVVHCPEIDKVVVFMHNGNNDQAYVAAGSVNASNETTSWGSATVLTTTNVESDGTGFVATWDNNINRVVVHYRDKDNGDKGTAQLVEIASNNSITVGSQHIFNNERTTYIASAFDSNANKHLVFFGTTSQDYARYRLATISTSSFSYGSQVQFMTYSNDRMREGQAVFDSDNNKILFAYRTGDNYGYIRVFSISGSTVTVGLRSQFGSNSVQPQNVKLAYNADQKCAVVAYTWAGNSDRGQVISGVYNANKTEFSFGSHSSFESYSTYDFNLAYSPKSKKAVLYYRDESISGGRVKYADITTTAGTNTASTAVGNPVESINEAAEQPHILWDNTNNRFVLLHRRDDTNFGGTARQAHAFVYRQAYTSSNLTANNFVGISDAAYSDGQTATIQVVGSVDDAQSGLTPGNKYYVQTDGTLSTTADTPSVLAGVALSATKLLIK